MTKSSVCVSHQSPIWSETACRILVLHGVSYFSRAWNRPHIFSVLLALSMKYVSKVSRGVAKAPIRPCVLSYILPSASRLSSCVGILLWPMCCKDCRVLSVYVAVSHLIKGHKGLYWFYSCYGCIGLFTLTLKALYDIMTNTNRLRQPLVIMTINIVLYLVLLPLPCVYGMYSTTDA